jgi:hypothetical protein
MMKIETRGRRPGARAPESDAQWNVPANAHNHDVAALVGAASLASGPRTLVPSP